MAYCDISDMVKANTTHGHAKRGNWSPEYRAFVLAKARCNNPNREVYKYYGGRGIEFRFNSFEEFFAELGPKPTLKHQVERMNNDGHYEIGNVKWATRSEQSHNQRRGPRGSYRPR